MFLQPMARMFVSLSQVTKEPLSRAKCDYRVVTSPVGKQTRGGRTAHKLRRARAKWHASPNVVCFRLSPAVIKLAFDLCSLVFLPV